MTTEEGVRKIIEEMTGQSLGDISADEDLLEACGLDSLAGLRMLATIERKCQVVFPNEELANLRTLNSLQNQIEKGS